MNKTQLHGQLGKSSRLVKQFQAEDGNFQFQGEWPAGIGLACDDCGGIFTVPMDMRRKDVQGLKQENFKHKVTGVEYVSH